MTFWGTWGKEAQYKGAREHEDQVSTINETGQDWTKKGGVITGNKEAGHEVHMANTDQDLFLLSSVLRHGLTRGNVILFDLWINTDFLVYAYNKPSTGQNYVLTDTHTHTHTHTGFSK